MFDFAIEVQKRLSCMYIVNGFIVVKRGIFIQNGAAVFNVLKKLNTFPRLVANFQKNTKNNHLRLLMSAYYIILYYNIGKISLKQLMIIDN